MRYLVSLDCRWRWWWWLGRNFFVRLQNQMGNNEPHSLSNATKTKFQDYEAVSQLAEGRTLVRNRRTAQLSVIVEHTFPNEELLNQYIKQNRGTLSLQHQFYLNAFDYEILSLANICSKQYKIVEYFDYQPHTLQAEIENRMDSGRKFSQQEAMSILCSCVLAMSHISKLELVHYTLNPADLVIDKEGVCKVVSQALSGHVFDFSPKDDFYYAPQTLKIFKRRSAPNTLTNKSAVFTLAMTLLNMLTLEPLHYLYDIGSFTIDLQQMYRLLSTVESDSLREILHKMLKYHSYERITFTELEEMLYEVIGGDRGTQVMKGSRKGQTQGQQIERLEESIVRIRQESNVIDSRNYSFTSSATPSQQLHAHPTLHSQNYVLSCLTLAADHEDKPQSDLSFLPSTNQDPIVMDECQHPSHNHNEDYTNRQSMISCPSQARLTHLSQRNQPLMENSNLSNLAETYNLNVNRQQHREDVFGMQENGIARHEKEGREGNGGKEGREGNGGKERREEEEGQPEYVTEQFKEGRYQGYKVGRYRHGFGTFYYHEGGKYCGQWAKNRMQGRGVLYYNHNKIAYEGEWQQDQLHGYGVLYNETIAVLEREFDSAHLELLNDQWIKYEGCFQDDLKHGQGTLYLSNGESFRGSFQRDQANGWGQFRDVRGEVSKGFWLMGALNSTE